MIHKFEDKANFEKYLLKILQIAKEHKAKSIRIFDYDFEFLAKKVYIDELHGFFLNSNKNKFFAVIYDDQKMRKDFPRLTTELQNFSHACEIHVLTKMREQIEEAFILIDNKHLLLRPNRHSYHGNYYHNEADLVSPYVDKYQELVDAAERVTLFTLGL